MRRRPPIYSRWSFGYLTDAPVRLGVSDESDFRSHPFAGSIRTPPNADFERIVGPVAAKQPARAGDGG
jgi:hypothetical protein